MTKKQPSPTYSPQKWHSSGFGFHKKSTVSALSTNQDIPALRPPKHSRNGTLHNTQKEIGFLTTKKVSIDFGAPKTVSSPLHQPGTL